METLKLVEGREDVLVRCLVRFRVKVVIKVQDDFSTLSSQSCELNKPFLHEVTQPRVVYYCDRIIVP